MAHASRRIRIRKARAAALVIVVAAIAAGLGNQLRATPPASSPGLVRRGDEPGGTPARVGEEAGDLDPALAAALRRAVAAAAQDGVAISVESGRRSAEQQEQLLREAVSKYGSEEEAARWVAPPESSPHVSGDAVDVGPSEAAAWLAEHGAAYGLCQVYANEPWHYELRPEAVRRGCPPMYADPTHDPRLRR